MKLISGKRTSRIDDIIAYIIVIAVVYLSGNPLFHINRYKQTVIIVLIISVLAFVMRYPKSMNISRNVLIAYNLILLSLLMTVLLNSDAEISTYIAIALQLTSAFLITQILSCDKFEDTYIKVLSFLMVCSLFFFFLQLTIPTVWQYFPKERGAYFTYVNVFYLHNYFLLPEIGNFILQRNCGIFWEPGCYQFFLNFALFLLLDREQRDHRTMRRRTMYLVILYIMAVITTKSTTGLILLILIIIIKFKYLAAYFISKNSRSFDKVAVGTILMVAVVLFLTMDGWTEIAKSLSKINSENYMGGKGIISRLSLDSLDMLFYRDRIHPFGVSFETIYAVNGYAVWNSIIEDTICLGYFFVADVLVGLFCYSKRHTKKTWLLLLIIIASLSAEALLHTVMIFTLMCYGYQRRKDKAVDYYASDSCIERGNQNEDCNFM